MIQTKEKETLASLLALIFKLQDETSFRDNFKRKQALDNLIKYAQSIGFTLEPDNPEFLPKLFLKILQEYNNPPELPPGNLPPPELVEIYEKGKQEEEARLQKLMASEKAYGNYNDYLELYKNFILKNKQELPPKVAEEIAKNAANRTIISLPRVAQPEFLSKEDKNRIIREAGKIIEDELQKIKTEGGKPQIVREAEKIVGNEWERIIEETKKIAAKPEIIQSVEEITRAEKPPPAPEEIPPLPQEVLVKLNQPPEEVSFLPIYTILHPKVAAAFFEKVVYTVPAKFLNLIAESASPEWQAMMQKGLFIEDIQASIKTLKAMGVPEAHPILKKLSDKAARLQEQQKFTIQIKDGQIIYKDTLAARIFERYYRFGKITGRHGIYDDDLKTKLPRLSPDLAWSQGGYAGFLRNRLNNFKFIINTYERISKFVTRGKYTSFLTPVRQFFSQKITQPVIKWLAKTAAGKAAKAGAKKAAGWVATKLGVKLAAEAGVAAAGAATGPPGWIVAAVLIGIDILKFIGKKFIGLIRKIVQEPEKALAAVGAGVLVLIFVPMPFALIGVIPIVFGGIGLLGWATAPAILSGAAGGIGAFFTVISAISFAAPIGLFVIILLSTIAVLTLFIVLVVSGAFILPKPVQEAAITTISPYTSEFFDVTKTATPNRLENTDLQTSPVINYTITITSKGKKLIHPAIREEINVSKEGPSISIPPHVFEDIPPEITSSWSTNYQISLDGRFKDSTINNNLFVSTEVEGDVGTHQGMASATVTVGKPPGDCPSGWPANVPGAIITEGPGAGSHSKQYNLDHGGEYIDQEAIDISLVNGIPVYATHEGIASGIRSGGGGGIQVSIIGICNGIAFRSYYAHLQQVLVKEGQQVSKGTLIALSDNTGVYSTGPHLHYEFKPVGNTYWRTEKRIKMDFPFIPLSGLWGCFRPNCGTI